MHVDRCTGVYFCADVDRCTSVDSCTGVDRWMIGNVNSTYLSYFQDYL